MDELIRSYITYLRTVGGYSEKTAVAYEHDLRRFEDWMKRHGVEVDDLTPEDARSFTVELYESKLKPATINKLLPQSL